MSNDTIQTIYECLFEQAGSRTKRSLEIIKEACESQVRRKVSDFSIATIGRISDEMGGVKAQAIRNKTGKHFRQLISAYETAYTQDIPKQTKADTSTWYNQIEDAPVRYQVLDLLAENKKLKNELNILKSVTTIEVDMRNQPREEQASHYLENKLTEVELRALTDFISEKRLADFGWSIGKNGRLLDAKGRPTTKVAFVDAIEKLATIIDVANGK